MSFTSLQRDDVGTVFRCYLRDQNDNPIDLTGNTQRDFIFKKPSAASLVVAGTVSGSATDGVLTYTTEIGDIDESGTWSVQIEVTLPTGNWKSDIMNFQVKENL